MGFFGELKRRNVFRVAVAYAIVAWLIIQVADIVLESIGAPEWVMQTLMLLLALGFIVSSMFAWAYEVTPEGIKRESEVDRSTSITRVTGRKLDHMIIGLLVVSLAYFVWEARIAELHEGAVDPGTALEPATQEAEVATTPVSELSIAVLPFENRSALPEDAFFADGMHDDLLTTLAKIGSMRVISRTSVMQYRNTEMTIPEIAKKLGVANILEGGVQRAGNQVRINVQLIDAATDEHVWAEIFDRELTAENLFAIQSEISKAVAKALRATLSPDEVQRIDTSPTDSLEAFNHYLRGRVIMAKRTDDDLERATQEFLEAVEIDPDFALAWVGVADTQCLLSNRAIEATGIHRETCRRAIDRALEIDPELGEAYAALGLLLMGNGVDFSGAEEALKTAIRFSPNYASSYHWLSNMLSFNPVRVREALRYAQRAAELDPESAIILVNLAATYQVFGDYETSRRYFSQLMESHPEMPPVHRSLADYYSDKGNLVSAIDEYRETANLNPGSSYPLALLAFSYLQIGALEEARRTRDLMIERFPDTVWIRVVELALALSEGRTADIRAQVAEILEDQPAPSESFFVGFAAVSNSDFDLAYEAYNLATRGELSRYEWDNNILGQYARDLCPMAMVLLETDGNKLRGNRLVNETIALYENEIAANMRHPERLGFDLCYLLAGDHEKAIAELEKQFEGNFTVDWIFRLSNPAYDSMRDEPRFVALLNRYEQRRSQQLTELRQQDQARPAFEP